MFNALSCRVGASQIFIIIINNNSDGPLVLLRKIIYHILFPRLQAIGGVMSLALCPQVMSRAPQHFRSSEMQTTFEGCFAHWSICLVISHHSGMSRQYTHRCLEGGCRSWTHASLGFPCGHSTFCSKHVEYVNTCHTRRY